MKALPETNQLVALTHDLEAPLFRVKETDGIRGVGLIDATIEGRIPNQRIQWVDVSLLLSPTRGQLTAFNTQEG